MKNFLNSVTKISKIRGIIIYCTTFFSLTSSENLAPPPPPQKNNENKKKVKKRQTKNNQLYGIFTKLRLTDTGGSCVSIYKIKT